MSQQLILSVVDQSPMRSGSTSGEALRETIELAAVAEELGYQRYWLAEHHSLPNFAGTSPEVLIGQVAARTKTIRVGSGGVMLPHYSAFKVAENFRMLESLYPGRIDLGIGRAPGSDQLTAAALSFPGRPKEIRHFPRQVVDLLGYLHGNLEDGHLFSQIHTAPGDPQPPPEVWLLGSRYESAYMAAQLGLPFAYAHFFGIGVDEGPAIVANYRQNFQPSSTCRYPDQRWRSGNVRRNRRTGAASGLQPQPGTFGEYHRSGPRHSAHRSGDGLSVCSRRVGVRSTVRPDMRGRRSAAGQRKPRRYRGTLPDA